jgi:hydrogenase maturation protease
VLFKIVDYWSNDALTTLIICYGNDLMGNDAFGRAVYDALPEEIEKVFAHQLLPELLETARRYERLIFVDAAHGEGEVKLYEITPSDNDTADFHQLGAETFLRLLDTLYDKTPKSYMCAGYFEEFELEVRDGNFDKKVQNALILLNETLTKNTI